MESLRNTRLLLLDCDGVLIRSERANLAYYNHLFARFGLPPVEAGDAKRARLLHTLSTPQVIETFFDAGQRDDAVAYAATLEYETFGALVDPEPGWDEVLGRLGRSLSICVATNRGRSARSVLARAGLGAVIGEVFTVHDVARPKPAPDLLEHALHYYDVPPRAALYVGDSELDRQAAGAAGVPFIGFRLPGGPAVESPWELEGLLQPRDHSLDDAMTA